MTTPRHSLKPCLEPLEARTLPASFFIPPPTVAAPVELTAAEVGTLLRRASAATVSEDGIIAVVDRNGRILGVRLEDDVFTNLPALADRVFAIDGAIAKARTAAFFANNNAPLTSRTVQFISQSTVTQREVESNPNDMDPDSIWRGPGFVAPIGTGGHFPPGVSFTPAVDLFGIEHTNRDSLVHPGADSIKGTGDDVPLAARFDIDPLFIPPGVTLYPPESYGFASGRMSDAQARGIGTLPGGIPIVKGGFVVGGIGVFYPGDTGYANEENSALSADFDPALPDRSAEAEFVAFAALGGSTAAGIRVGALDGVAPVAGIDLPYGRIDLVGITLDIIGPGGFTLGPQRVMAVGAALGPGVVNGKNQKLLDPGADGIVGTGDDGGPIPGKLLPGLAVPEGWLVAPHAGVGITEAEVVTIVTQGIAQANATRAAIRLPLGNRTRMVFAVTDLEGEVVGLFRMADSTVFSIDVAVAKARNVAYYADPAALAAIDALAGIPAGTAFTNRTFRYLAQPRFPLGIDGQPPGPFSIINDGSVDPKTGLLVGPRLPASAFTSVFGFDAFNPGTNFRNTRDVAERQNGIVFFPGSAPIYASGSLRAGFGVSGDGVDQDDVVTFAGAVGFEVTGVLRADEVFFKGVRLPYIKFNRNPKG